MSEVQPTQRLPLPNYAAMAAISGMVRKRLFGGLQVPLLPFTTQGFLLLWEGALLGLARWGSARILIRTLLGSQALESFFLSFGATSAVASQRANDEESVTWYMEKAATDGLAHFGRPPETLIDLFSVSFAPPEFDFRTREGIRGLRGKALSVEQAMLRGSGWFIIGLSLGCYHLEIARNLCRDPYGKRDSSWWSELKAAGGLGPPTPEELSGLGNLEDVAAVTVLGLVSVYADSHYPELTQQLGLT